MRGLIGLRPGARCCLGRGGRWWLASLLMALPLFGAWAAPAAAKILVPMDLSQSDHLKAYGLAYWSLQQGWDVEWLLNYRGGSFLFGDHPEVAREARLRGILFEDADGAAVSQIHATIAEANMEVILLETAPRIAIYTPANREPWDDAVTLALTYAQIPYATVWDREVLAGRLADFDWLHLHHEDFTGQFGKFYINYRTAPWFLEERARNEEIARELGFPKVSQMKAAVAQAIRNYVVEGGFLFSMCSAPETFEIALAAQGADICPPEADGDPPDPRAQERLDFSRALAFTDFRLEKSAYVNAFSNIDGHLVNTPLRQPLGYFRLFPFSAKYDPVPTMLTQDHVTVLEDFYGLSTSFRRETLKKGVTILADEPGKPWVKYVHGNLGRGTFTYLGGHDPEDKQHAIGDPPTQLELHRNSPGYRLILNNILFPAARKKELKT